MPVRRDFSEQEQSTLKELFYSDFSKKQVRAIVGAHDRVIDRYWNSWFTEDERKARHARLSGLSKVGELNPMFGKVGMKHHNAKEKISTTQGYRSVWAPAWYKGKTYQGRVLEHILVWCGCNGYDHIPEGWVVHHLDHSRDNNTIDNLLVMTIADHLAYHNTKSAKRATTILKRSREKALPKRLPSQ